MLMRTSQQTLTEQLVARFSERIRSRLLPAGSRLPSVRECARQQEVSPHTVVAAYDQLVAAGLVDARKQKGFYVRDVHVLRQIEPDPDVNSAKFAIKNIANPALHGRPRIDATALIRGMFARNNSGVTSSQLQPGMGVLPPEWMESDFLGPAVRKVSQGRNLLEASLRYGEPLGDASLREALSRKLRDYTLDVQSNRIITTLGATQALDIVSRTLLKAGDYVMVEEPGWAVEFARLDALGMRILPVPRQADGPDLAVMARYCEEHKPKLYVSVSVLHNPTGACLSPSSAHRILQLANLHDFHIVEDDTYCHIAAPHATRMSALDGLQRTIYVSGFAKILAPNWRIGFMATPEHLTERLLDTKLLTSLTTPALLEKALAHCINEGHLRKHSERVRARLDAARARAVRLALQSGCSFAAEPAGLFGWVETGIDTEPLAQRMLDDGILLAPGTLFNAARQPSTLMRINFATTQEAGFWKKFAQSRESMQS
ncbi:MAG: PLP-dependent aminotransferase family protein [Burkholderiales bacterium]|nr:MAG: PLP-dependent aminotransferase family protein [Burkholderiales bacterium]